VLIRSQDIVAEPPNSALQAPSGEIERKPAASIEVGYHPLFGMIVLVFSIFVLITGLTANSTPLLFMGAANGLLAWAFLTRPRFIVYRNRIELRSILGATLRTIEIGSRARLRVDGRRVLVEQSSEERLPKIGGSLVNPRHMARLRDEIELARALKSR
jgi:hypothetical protein